MKKNERNKQPSISPSEAIQFLEDVRRLQEDIDEPTIAISLRVPSNILRSVKLKAKSKGQKYQSLMIAYIRKGLQDRNS